MITLNGLTGITAPDFEPSSSTAPTNGMFLPTTNTLAWSTNSTERLRLDASGNLGLGVTPSGWGSGFKAFQIGARGSVYAGSDASMRLAYNAFYDGTGYKRIAASSASQWIADIDGSFAWFQAGSSTAGSAITFTQAMTLDASGNLGIGTSSPSTYGQLSLYRASGDVEAAVVTGGANYATYRIQNSTNRYSMQIRTDVSNAWVLRDETNSANRLVVDTSGNLLVGTTTSDARLHVVKSLATIAWMQNGSGTGVALYAGNSSWTGTSDETVKDIIEPIIGAVSKVNVLRSVIGKFKDDKSETRRAFLIAQDVQKVLPEAVSVMPTGKLGIQYTDTIPLLVAAIKELSAELNELKQKVNA